MNKIINNQFRKQEFEKRRIFKGAESLCKSYECPIFQNCLLEIKQLKEGIKNTYESNPDISGELQQEIQRLKNDNAVMKAGLIKIRDEELELYKRVFEEIRNYIRNHPYKDLMPIELLVVRSILDQVKGSDQ